MHSHDFEKMVLPHVDSLFGRALKLERNAADARDLVQDTLERALRNFDQFDRRGSAQMWLLRVMFNLFVDRWRRRGRETDVDARFISQVPSPDPYQPAAWEFLTTADVDRAMAHLEHPFLEVVQLRFRKRMSYQQISRTLKIPPATVGTRLNRARQKIRALLNERPTSVVISAPNVAFVGPTTGPTASGTIPVPHIGAKTTTRRTPLPMSAAG